MTSDSNTDRPNNDHHEIETSPTHGSNHNNRGRFGRIVDSIASHSIVATGVTTLCVVLVLTGLLWAGTGVNTGIEAPSAITVPTVWAAAIVGAGVLTIVFAFLAFAFAYSNRTKEGDSTPSGDSEPTTDDGDEDVSNGSSVEDTPKRSSSDSPEIISSAGSGENHTTSGSSVDAAVQSRVDENYPDHLDADGNSELPESGPNKKGTELQSREDGKDGGPTVVNPEESDTSSDEVINDDDTGSSPSEENSESTGGVIVRDDYDGDQYGDTCTHSKTVVLEDHRRPR